MTSYPKKKWSKHLVADVASLFDIRFIFLIKLTESFQSTMYKFKEKCVRKLFFTEIFMLID